jgi:capsular polysaccharide biosynthesis protein
LQGESLYAAIDGFSYYHWLTGVVPRLVVAKSAPYSANIANWIVTSNHKRHGSFQQETVKALGLNGQIVHLEKGSRLRCDSLRCMEEPSYAEHTRLKAWSLEALQEFGSIVTSGCDNQIDLPKRIFVRRHLARRRRLINEQEVERLLVEQYGFAVVDLETKSLAEQILLFRQVEAVAGMHGAGFTNLAFARVKPRVIEIASKEWPNRCFEYLTTQVGGSFGRVVGSALGKGFGADVTVDLRELKKTLAHLLS